jgi:hypothetical protein
MLFNYFIDNFYNYENLALNNHLISNYLVNLFNKTSAVITPKLIENFSVLESWFMYFKNTNKKVPYDFKTDFFCEGKKKS